MKAIVFFFCFIFSVPAIANNIIVNGTRFIFPGDEKEITVQLTNKADRPSLAQSWLDTGDANATPDTISTPFQITPPIARVDANSGQTLRIKLANKAVMDNSKESLWWLNILEIPPNVTDSQKKSQNALQLAIRSRFKFIYRPTGLGNREDAANQLQLSVHGQQLVINNPTPFYLTVTNISDKGKTPLNNRAIMLAPLSNNTITTTASVTPGQEVTINNINDYGADIAVKLIVK